FGGGLEEGLAADGEADAADSVAVDVGAVLQERNGRIHVFVGCPAEGVRVAVAVAFAAAVEEQDAVAVASEHPRLLLCAGSAGCCDHCGVILGGDVPASECQAVAGREAHVLMCGAQLGGRDGGARGVREDVGERQWEEDDVAANDGGGCQQETPWVAAVEAVVAPSRRPESCGPDAN